eukprot:2051811-Rhodomonas_salina.1
MGSREQERGGKDGGGARGGDSLNRLGLGAWLEAQKTLESRRQSERRGERGRPHDGDPARGSR